MKDLCPKPQATEGNVHQQNKGKILDGCNHLQALRITKNHHNGHKFIFDWQSAKLITIVSSL
jgi:hypothetical protein